MVQNQRVEKQQNWDVIRRTQTCEETKKKQVQTLEDKFFEQFLRDDSVQQIRCQQLTEYLVRDKCFIISRLNLCKECRYQSDNDFSYFEKLDSKLFNFCLADGCITKVLQEKDFGFMRKGTKKIYFSLFKILCLLRSSNNQIKIVGSKQIKRAGYLDVQFKGEETRTYISLPSELSDWKDICFWFGIQLILVDYNGEGKFLMQELFQGKQQEARRRTQMFRQAKTQLRLIYNSIFKNNNYSETQVVQPFEYQKFDSRDLEKSFEGLVEHCKDLLQKSGLLLAANINNIFGYCHGQQKVKKGQHGKLLFVWQGDGAPLHLYIESDFYDDINVDYQYEQENFASLIAEKHISHNNLMPGKSVQIQNKNQGQPKQQNDVQALKQLPVQDLKPIQDIIHKMNVLNTFQKQKEVQILNFNKGQIVHPGLKVFPISWLDVIQQGEFEMLDVSKEGVTPLQAYHLIHDSVFKYSKSHGYKVFIGYSGAYKKRSLFYDLGTVEIRQNKAVYVVDRKIIALDSIYYENKVSQREKAIIQIGYNLFFIIMQQPSLYGISPTWVYNDLPFYTPYENRLYQKEETVFTQIQSFIQRLARPCLSFFFTFKKQSIFKKVYSHIYNISIASHAIVDWKDHQAIYRHAHRLIFDSDFNYFKHTNRNRIDPHQELLDMVVESMYMQREQKKREDQLQDKYKRVQTQYSYSLKLIYQTGLLTLCSIFFIKTTQDFSFPFRILRSCAVVSYKISKSFVSYFVSNVYKAFYGDGGKKIIVGGSNDKHYKKQSAMSFKKYNMTVLSGFKSKYKNFNQVIKDCNCKRQFKFQNPNNVPQVLQGEAVQYGSCVVNAFSALFCRQAASFTRCDMKVVYDFQEYVYSDKSLLTNAIQKWESQIKEFDIYAYFEHVKTIDPVKAHKYKQAYEQCFYEKGGETFELFPKTGEKFFVQKGNKIQDYSNRPRAIHNPPTWIKAVGGFLNYQLLNFFKNNYSQFCCGLSDTQIRERIQDDRKNFNNPILFAIDGSSHDSNQHQVLMEIVDSRMLLKMKVFPYSNVPAFIYNQLLELLLSLETRIVSFSKIRGARTKLFSGIINGTVLSGNPTTTTLGNTLRVSEYIGFVMDQALITKYKSYHNGDDILLMLEKEDVNRFKECFWQVYTPEVSFKKHGLGQVAKMLTDLGSDGYDFSGRLGCFQEGKLYTWDNVQKVSQLGIFTDSKISLETLKQCQSEAFCQMTPYSHVQQIQQYMPKPNGQLKLLQIYYNKINSLYLPVYLMSQGRDCIDEYDYLLQNIKNGQFKNLYSYELLKESIQNHSYAYQLDKPYKTGAIIGCSQSNIMSNKQNKNKINLSQKTVQNISKEISEVRNQLNQNKRKNYKKKRINNNGQNVSQYTSNLNRGSKSKYRNQFNLNKPVSDYITCVLNPFNSIAVRGPSDFYQPTCLLRYKMELDFSPASTQAVILVNPSCFQTQAVTNGFTWVNLITSVNPTNGGQVSFPTRAPNNTNNISMLHPLAGGASVTGTYTDYWTSDPTDTTGKRWVSARTVACGLRLIPTGTVLNRSGTLTAGIVPGKTVNYNSSLYNIPSVQSLRQYPTSYQANLVGTDVRGQELIWLPLDPKDDIFIQGSGANSIDSDTATGYYRSPMYMLLSGINIADTYRIEVSTVVEFVPTMQFDAWSEAKPSQISEMDVLAFRKEVAQVPGKVIDGQLGKALDKMNEGIQGKGSTMADVAKTIIKVAGQQVLGNTGAEIASSIIGLA